jgi:hypothetical protein
MKKINLLDTIVILICIYNCVYGLINKDYDVFFLSLAFLLYILDKKITIK